MNDIKYKIIFEPEKNGGFHAYCPSLPGCHTFGATSEEALKNIKDAIEGYLFALEDKGLYRPDPDYGDKST